MKVIDNFLEEEYFNTLTDLICSTNADKQGAFAWFYGHYYYDTVPGDISVSEDPLNYFFTQLIYSHYCAKSAHYEFLLPLCGEIDKVEGGIGGIHTSSKGIKSILRMRANYFPHTSILHEYGMHTDYAFSHTAALLSLNTCDGYTKIADGTKISSVANRMLFFDAGEDHCSTTTTNAKARFNLIVNYL